MLADELAFATIRELGERIRTKDVSVEEVVRATIARAEKLQPRLNSYITLAAEQALEAGRQADAELRQGRYRGPLHGVPVVSRI